MNRAEYANTVRDLLAVDVELKDLLPLDTSINGFDNNSESMHIMVGPMNAAAQQDLVGCFDLPADKPTVVEFDLSMEPAQA